jgi:hypothetical protein
MSFNDFFNALMDDFQKQGRLTTIRPSGSRIQWPNGFGVYTLWHPREVDVRNLIYVGKTGKYVRSNGSVRPNGGSFCNRTARWTPYRFCESRNDPEQLKYTFRYGPKCRSVSEQGKIKYDTNAYSQTIPYRQLIIVTFDVRGSLSHSPASLESLILTQYLLETKTLPPANNEL